MIQKTSVEAYTNLPMADLQHQMLKLLETYPDRTNQELGALMNKDASTISGINVPLRRRGLIEKSTERTCNVTGRRVIAWRIKKPQITENAYRPSYLKKLAEEKHKKLTQ